MLLKGALIKEGRLCNNFRIKGGAYWRGVLIVGRALITVNTVYINHKPIYFSWPTVYRLRRKSTSLSIDFSY